MRRYADIIRHTTMTQPLTTARRMTLIERPPLKKAPRIHTSYPSYLYSSLLESTSSPRQTSSALTNFCFGGSFHDSLYVQPFDGYIVLVSHSTSCVIEDISTILIHCVSEARPQPPACLTMEQSPASGSSKHQYAGPGQRTAADSGRVVTAFPYQQPEAYRQQGAGERTRAPNLHKRQGSARRQGSSN
jgi:hypothetical protein